MFSKKPKENQMKKSVRIAVVLFMAAVFTAQAGAAHAISIKSLLAGGAKFNGKKVTVSGRVTKVNTGIMGKNWIHVKDASTPQEIVLTSTQTAKPGQHVVATCTAAANKDFGAGYFYKLILENCVLKAK